MYITDKQERNPSGKYGYGHHVILELEDYPANHHQWADETYNLGRQLKALLGPDWDLWAEINLPSNEIMTYKARTLIIKAALAAGIDNLRDELECPHVLPEQSCRVCQAQARLTYSIEEALND